MREVEVMVENMYRGKNIKRMKITKGRKQHKSKSMSS